MGPNKKIIFISLALMFFVGAAAGYYYGVKSQSDSPGKIVFQSAEDKSDTISAEINSGKKAKVKKKLELLKNYTDFVLLPVDSIKDPVAYADDMGKQVESIDDADITAKFYATGEKIGKEQKIIDFLDSLNTSIQADLK